MNIKYRLLPLLSNRLTSEHISPVSFQYWLAHQNAETKMMSNINDTTEQQWLKWQMEEHWDDN